MNPTFTLASDNIKGDRFLCMCMTCMEPQSQQKLRAAVSQTTFELRCYQFCANQVHAVRNTNDSL